MLVRSLQGRVAMVPRPVTAWGGSAAALAVASCQAGTGPRRWRCTDSGRGAAAGEAWKPQLAVDVNELLIRSMRRGIQGSRKRAADGSAGEEVAEAGKRGAGKMVVRPLSAAQTHELRQRLHQPKANALEMERRLLEIRRDHAEALLPLELHAAVVRAYVQEGRAPQAKRVLLDVHRLTGHAYASHAAYELVVRELCQQGSVASVACALEIFQLARAAGGWERWHSTTLILLEGSYVAGHYEKARGLLAEMVASGDLRASTLGPFVSKAVTAGRIRTAERIVADMIALQLRPSSQAFTSLMSHYSARGDTEAVDRLANLMHEVGVPQSRYSFGCLVKARATAGLLDEALELYKQMPEKGYRTLLSVHSVLGRELAKAGRAEEAESILKETIAQGGQRFARNFCDVAVGYVMAKQCDRAMEILQKDLPEDGHALCQGSMAVVHKAACMSGQLSFAKKLEETFPQFVGPYCIRNEIAAYALRGDFEKMLEAIKDMRLSGLQTFSAVNRLLENILTAAETAGNGDEVMGHMEAISKTLQIRPLVFWEILLALVQSNKQFHDEVMRKAIEVVPFSERNDVCNFASRLVYCVDVENLEKVSEAVPRNMFLSKELLARAAVASIQAEHPERLERLVDVVKVLRKFGWDKVSLYTYSSHKLCQMGFVDLAKEISSLEETRKATGFLEGHMQE